MSIDGSPVRSVKSGDQELELELAMSGPGAVELSSGRDGPAQFVQRSEPMELCREYMRQRAWMVARHKGVSGHTTDEMVDRVLDKLFAEDLPVEVPLEKERPMGSLEWEQDSAPSPAPRIEIHTGYTPPPPAPEPRHIVEGLSLKERSLELRALIWNIIMITSIVVMIAVNICVAMFDLTGDKGHPPYGFISLIPCLLSVWRFSVASTKLSEEKGKRLRQRFQDVLIEPTVSSGLRENNDDNV